MRTRLLCYIISVLVILMIAAAGCTQTGPATATPVTTVAVVPATTAAGTLTSNETLVAFVKEAVSYANAHGKEAAIAEFNKANGSFVRGELYLYAYDFNGTTLVHPVNPEKIGVCRINETDAHGNYFIRGLRDTAINGSGFYEFYYINPVHNKTVEKKLGYVEKVDDSWWLGSGIYRGTA